MFNEDKKSKKESEDKKEGEDEKEKIEKKLNENSSAFDIAAHVINKVRKDGGNLTLDDGNLRYYNYKTYFEKTKATKIRIKSNVNSVANELVEKLKKPWTKVFANEVYENIETQVFKDMVPFYEIENFFKSKDKELVFESKFEKTSSEIIKEVNHIMEKGDPVKTILDVHATMHVGDDMLARTILVAIGVQSIKNSAGVQPKVSGESGKGKTHCCKAMIHLIPKEYKFVTTLSDRAIYYLEPNPGTVIFSDDVDLSETLEGIIKRSTSNFQEGDTYTTLDKNRDMSELFIPPRIVWLLTSVDDDQSMQLLNRQFSCTIDDSLEQDKKVFEFQKELARTGRLDFPENREVEICRAIFRDIKQHLYTVLIPYIDEIIWRGYKNRRNFPIFQDIIKAFTVLRHRQREKNEKGDIIYSTIEDFNDALNLYTDRGKNQATKLTNKEMEFCEILNDAEEHTYEEVQAELDIGEARVSQLLYGKGKNGIGLLEKVPGLSVKKQNVKISLDKTENRKVITLNNFNAEEDNECLVALKEGAKKKYK